MSETLELTEFCKQVEDFFPNYHLTYYCNLDREITYVEIRGKNNTFTDGFLRFMFDNLKDNSIYFKSDITGQPIVKIIVE